MVGCIGHARCEGTFAGPSCWHVVDDGAYSISVTGERQSPINICTTNVKLSRPSKLP